MPKWLKIYLSGVLMGAADVVPGVSGGTVAFIVGVYDRLIAALSGVNKDSIQMLFKGDVKALWRHFDGGFLLALGAGVVTSIFLIAGLITHLLAVYPTYLWSFFFGLILASAVFLLKQVNHFSVRHGVVLIVGIIAGASLSLLVPTSMSTSSPMVFVAGMIAICAMILPGISGSFLLLIMGMYSFVLNAVKSFDLTVIIIFAAGALVGLLSFSKLLNYLLNKAHAMTLSFLTGIMLGALVKVWPWKETLSWEQIGDKKIPVETNLILPWQASSYQFLNDLAVPMAFILVGVLMVFYASYIYLRNEDKS
ncbi:DUF368 domain-containing protein [Marinomonas posidonica]|uniref:DUF368 domain-containing protein n=1 Tax=Marinomonas posidonica (strain CECT 7376 / NCIMB 14433 / IVIA-Po-181) TaxID=491952 RepID=F6CXZ8_MARPP|nr:DUF368 domain-containing protein [Marinomonas posidonica]AEF55630.1 protein of unknown function DUF368 [Marinomonas posidonica IVIA-Po-181]